MNIAVGAVGSSPSWTLPRHYVDQLRREFPQHAVFDVCHEQAFGRALQEADVALAAAIERRLVPSLTRLRWIQATAAGVGHMLSAELAASPIVLTSARGIRTRAVAEHVLLVALALTRRLPLSLSRQAQHVWAHEEHEAAPSRTLLGKQMGIVGLGSIGAEVARLAVGLGMRVSATRRCVTNECPAGIESVWSADRLSELLAASDVVVLAAPLTRSTRHIIRRATLGCVKRGALLVNVSRGALIDDQAVIEALADGRLGGAALDVFTSEPLDGSSPYWSLPNVILTPHVSGSMEDYWPRLMALFTENLRRFERGDPLHNVVDKAAGY